MEKDNPQHMPMIDAQTVIYALLGRPVGHSLSPALHNAAFRDRGLNCVYLACDVGPDELGGAVEGARSLGFGGLNITSPHKEAVIKYLDVVSPEAALIRSVNTVVNKDGVMHGYSTDGAGFCRFLQQGAGSAADPAGRRVLIIGAGGAARSIAFSLAREGVKSLTVANRTLAHAVELKELISAHTSFRGTCAIPLEEEPLTEELRKSSLIVYSLASDHDFLKKILVVGGKEEGAPGRQRTLVDLRYAPAETEIMRLFRLSGGEAFNGKCMLLWQAVLAFELFTAGAGNGAPVETMRRAIELR